MIYRIADINVKMDIKNDPLLSQAKPYEIDENSNVDIEFIDGFNNSIVRLQRIQYGKSLTLPENPKHDDYVFVGWFKDNEKKEEINAIKEVAEKYGKKQK